MKLYIPIDFYNPHPLSFYQFRIAEINTVGKLHHVIHTIGNVFLSNCRVKMSILQYSNHVKKLRLSWILDLSNFRNREG